MEYQDYFEFRRVRPDDYTGFELPHYLRELLSAVENPRVLDFGCGFGQMLHALRHAGIMNAEGIDIEPHAIQFCQAQGFACTDALANQDFVEKHSGCFDFILMSHVLEHFPKGEIIGQLMKVRSMLKRGGALIVMVPNAQAHTGAYWAYEDFTHHLLFTSGSLYYVLKSAGFPSVEFVDIDCTAGMSSGKRISKKILLRIYAANYHFWNRITGSSIHRPSPLIFSYEIKAVARV